MLIECKTLDIFQKFLQKESNPSEIVIFYAIAPYGIDFGEGFTKVEVTFLLLGRNNQFLYKEISSNEQDVILSVKKTSSAHKLYFDKLESIRIVEGRIILN